MAYIFNLVIHQKIIFWKDENKPSTFITKEWKVNGHYMQIYDLYPAKTFVFFTIFKSALKFLNIKYDVLHILIYWKRDIFN